MRNDHQLEARVLLLALVDNPRQGFSEPFHVPLIEVRGGLVEGEDAAVVAEGLSERHPDHQRRQHLLSSRAAPSHVELCQMPVPHHQPVVMRALVPCVLQVSLDLDRVDVVALVRHLPDLFHKLVDLFHLDLVVPHQRLIQGEVVLLKVLLSTLGRLQFDALHLVVLVDVFVLGFRQRLLELLDRLVQIIHPAFLLVLGALQVIDFLLQLLLLLL
mmetsp:Transcript_57895/g.135953  ORF Transcript_57895/g.135953 Transcript_57895/m.135953 type:complete len:215 (+) Transcript_57895:308-952(+)